MLLVIRAPTSLQIAKENFLPCFSALPAAAVVKLVSATRSHLGLSTLGTIDLECSRRRRLARLSSSSIHLQALIWHRLSNGARRVKDDNTRSLVPPWGMVADSCWHFVGLINRVFPYSWRANHFILLIVQTLENGHSFFGMNVTKIRAVAAIWAAEILCRNRE